MKNTMTIKTETTCENSKRVVSYIARKINLNMDIDTVLMEINKLLEKHKYNDFLIAGRGGSHIWISNKVSKNRIAIIN